MQKKERKKNILLLLTLHSLYIDAEGTRDGKNRTYTYEASHPY